MYTAIVTGCLLELGRDIQNHFGLGDSKHSLLENIYWGSKPETRQGVQEILVREISLGTAAALQPTEHQYLEKQNFSLPRKKLRDIFMFIICIIEEKRTISSGYSEESCHWSSSLGGL